MDKAFNLIRPYTHVPASAYIIVPHTLGRKKETSEDIEKTIKNGP